MDNHKNLRPKELLRWKIRKLSRKDHQHHMLHQLHMLHQHHMLLLHQHHMLHQLHMLHQHHTDHSLSLPELRPKLDSETFTTMNGP